MAAITADTFFVIDESALLDEADGLNWAAFDARAAGDTAVPHDFGSDGKRVFKHRFKHALVPGPRIQSESSG